VTFGGEGVVRQNNREEQRKIIRYNHLVTNLVVFHNVVSMTRVLQELVDEGYPVTPEIIGRLSPYKTEYINRFGHDELRFHHVPPPINEDPRLSPALSTRELERGYGNITRIVLVPHVLDAFLECVPFFFSAFFLFSLKLTDKALNVLVFIFSPINDVPGHRSVSTLRISDHV